MLIIGAAGEEVLLGLHFSMGTVWADTTGGGQPRRNPLFLEQGFSTF